MAVTSPHHPPASGPLSLVIPCRVARLASEEHVWGERVTVELEDLDPVRAATATFTLAAGEPTPALGEHLEVTVTVRSE